MEELKLGKAGRILNLKKRLKKLSVEDILEAVEQYNRFGGRVESYDKSTSYDLVVGNELYPPKAILGLAASNHLGLKVLSQYFTGGEGSACFSILRTLGFTINPKTHRPSSKDGLILHEAYSREDVCRIFSPNTRFKKGTGLWGLHGIIPDAPCPNDFIFFVTLSLYEGNDYEDSITADGYLLWKSQNQHSQKSKVIRRLIKHDHDINNVYLFLRASKKDNYTYLGPLAFQDWDPSSNKPVHMQWQILNWPLKTNLIEDLGLHIKPPLVATYKQIAPPLGTMQLKERHAPCDKPNKQATNQTGVRNPDWSRIEQRNRELGLQGEQLAIEYERQALRAAGREDLAERVEHIALSNSAAGYDLLSFDSEGHPKHIEVKTTSGPVNTPFYISRNEVERSNYYGRSYWVYRIYNYSPDAQEVDFFKVQGPTNESLKLEAESFKATVA